MNDHDLSEESVPESVDEIVPQDPETTKHPPVSVVVEGPVRVQQLPSRTSAPRSLPITVVEQIAGEDLRRRVIRLHVPSLIVDDAEVNVPVMWSTTKQGVDDDSGFILGISAVLEITSSDSVWIKSTGAASTLSVAVENWAD
jgi:hypothetical protein